MSAEEAIANVSAAFETMTKGIGEAEFHNYNSILLEGLDTLQRSLVLTDPDGTVHDALDLARPGIASVPVVAAALLGGLRDLTDLLQGMRADIDGWKLPPDLEPDWNHWLDRLALCEAVVQQAGSASRTVDEDVWRDVALPLLAGYYTESQPGVLAPPGLEPGQWFKKPPGIVLPFSILAAGFWYAVHGPSAMQKALAEAGDVMSQWGRTVVSAVGDALGVAGDALAPIGDALATALKWIGGALAVGIVGWFVMKGRRGQ